MKNLANRLNNSTSISFTTLQHKFRHETGITLEIYTQLIRLSRSVELLDT